MYFWNIEKLNNDLNKGLSQIEDAKYLAVFVFMWSFFSFPFFASSSYNMYDYLSEGFYIVFSLFEIFILYRINGGSNGKNFLSRYLSLGFVSAVRWIILFIFPLILFYGLIIGFYFGEDIPLEATIFDFSFLMIFVTGYLLYEIKYWKKLKMIESHSAQE